MKKYIIFCALFIHSFSQSLYSYELTIVSMFRNTAPYLREWVEYHRMVGVDHFWLYNDESTDNWEEVLTPYIQEGLVDVFYWPRSANVSNWVGSQLAAFSDGVKHAQGTAKWVALIDLDEFLLPMQDATVTECLAKHFSQASAVYVNWRNFGTSGVHLEEGEPMLFSLTACSDKLHPRNAVGKSLLRPECVDAVQTSHFATLNNRLSYTNGDGEMTLFFEGPDLKTDSKNHSHFIRINHYAFRDENYFWKIKFPGDTDHQLIRQQYDAYNKKKDFAITDLIKNKHPESYKKIWENYHSSGNSKTRGS